MQLLMSAQCSSCGSLYLHLSRWLGPGCSWHELLRYIQIYSIGIRCLCVDSYDQHVAYMHKLVDVQWLLVTVPLI